MPGDDSHTEALARFRSAYADLAHEVSHGLYDTVQDQTQLDLWELRLEHLLEDAERVRLKNKITDYVAEQL